MIAYVPAQRVRAEYAEASRDVTQPRLGSLFAKALVAPALMAATVIGLSVPVVSTQHGRVAHAHSVLIHAERALGMHPNNLLSPSEEIVLPEIPAEKMTDGAWNVFWGTKHMSPQDIPLYNSLREWASITNPSSKQLGVAELSKVYDLKALDKLGEAKGVLPRFLDGVKASMAADRDPLTTPNDKAALALAKELDKLTPEYQGPFAQIFFLPLGMSPQAQRSLNAIFEAARQGQPIMGSLKSYEAQLQENKRVYLSTRTDYELARQNGLLAVMKLVVQVTGADDVSAQLTVTRREIGNMDIAHMQGYKKGSGKSAKGPEQIVTQTMVNLLDHYGENLAGKIASYLQEHPDLSGSERQWLMATSSQLAQYASLQHEHLRPGDLEARKTAMAVRLKDNYFMHFAINHLSLQHDRTALVRTLAATFSTDQGVVEQYLSKPEQESIINFMGLPTAIKLSTAYLTNDSSRGGWSRRTPISRILTPLQLSQNRGLKPDMPVGDFFRTQITPFGKIAASYQLHEQADRDGVQQQPTQPPYQVGILKVSDKKTLG